MFLLLLFAVNSTLGQNLPGHLPFGVNGPQQRLASLGSPSVIEMSERQILSSIHRRTNPETNAAKTAPAAPGDLDPTFGTGGKVFTSFGRPDRFGDAAAVQADGKIVTAGTSRSILSMDFALTRFNPDGSIDTTFGVGGKVETDFGDTSEIVTAIAIQSDGKIVAVGLRSNNRFAMARYNGDGTLDTTFDVDGKVTNSLELGSAVVIAPDGKIITVGGAFSPSVARFNADGSLDTTFEGDGIVGIPSGNSNLYFYARAVAVQTDGKVLTAGFTSDYSVTPSRVYFTLFRFNANGSLDSTFDGDGRATAFYNDRQTIAYAMTIQPDGKIVTVGADRGLYFAAARHNPDGSLDTTFGVGGTTILLSELYGRARAVAIQPDGKIVIAGRGSYRFVLARLNSNGTLDPTFDGDGTAVTAFSQESGIRSVATLADGRIIAVGNGYGLYNNNNIDLNIARYNPNGSLDATFDGDGKLLLQTGVNTNDSANAVAIQADGKIVSAGGSNSRGALTRHNPDGSLDTSFDTDGRAVISDNGYLTAVAIQTDGKIVAAGYTYDIGGQGIFLLNRLNFDGSPDTTFDGDGRAAAAFAGFGAAFGYDAVIQSDGKIVVAGYVHRQASQAYTFALARFNADGSLDNSFSLDGRLTTDFDNDRSIANAVSIQTDGKIVAAGCALVADSAIRFALARYNTDGSLDTTFDSDGKVTTNGLNCANDMIIQNDGKILAAGSAPSNNPFSDNPTDLAMARYNTNGSLDTTFDGDGLLTTAFDDHDSSASAVAIQPDGKIIAGGSKYYYDYYEGYNYDETPAFARYNGDGSLDTGFGAGGRMSNFLGVEGYLADFAMQSDGKIVAAGVGWIGDSDFLLTRYLTGTSSPSVRVSGRVTTPDGRGLRNATVSLTDSLGVRQTATTSSFGLFAFPNVSAGGTYVIGVNSKRYRFASRNMTVNSNLADVDFVGLE